MNTHSLIVISDRASGLDEVLADAESALSVWQTDERPPLRACSVEQLFAEPAVLNDAGVVWCVLGNVSGRSLFELVGEMQDRRVPVLLTREGETAGLGEMHDAGVLVCPPGTEAHVTGVMLQSLWSQSPVLRALQAEVQLLRQQQGGLTGEMDKIDEELRLAAQLQREFLPDGLPEMEGVACRVLWRPATYVSGDVYDVIRLDEHHMGLFIADAVGHGVPAALLTMFIKRALHTKVVDPALPNGYRLLEPSETMAQLNRDMLEHNHGHVRFTTACYGVINTQTRKLTIARGGHPYPLLLRADGRTEEIEPEGPLLGVFADEPFEQATVQLAVGDRLLLYSDGFEMAFPGEDIDAANAPDHRVANTQYTHEFETLRRGDLDAAMEQFALRLDAQAGSLNQRDDLTVLCLAVQEQAAANGMADEKEMLSRSRSPLSAAASM